jgi:hypothetical protein
MLNRLDRFVPLALAVTLTSVAASAYADDVPPPIVRTSPNPLTGIVLTSVGGSMLLGAPITVMVGAAIASANGPYSYAALGPIVIGAFGGACIGLGMLIPGIVMLATHKRAPHHADDAVRATSRAQVKEPTWMDLRAPAGTPRAFSIPLLRTSF